MAQSTEKHGDKHMTRASGVLMDESDVTRALRRISHEIVERNRGAHDVVLIGIPTRGVPLAERIAQNLKAIENVNVPTGALDVALYRDDYSTRAAAPQPTKIAFDVTGKVRGAGG
jgi:pyrimidine operon attenuation protein/uracil phosphoribosyltransferase